MSNFNKSALTVTDHATTGVDRWGTGGDASPHVSTWGDSIGIVPPLFSSEKLRGI